MNKPLEEFDLARIAGEQTIVQLLEFDQDAGLWTARMLSGGERKDGRGIVAVSLEDLIPLSKMKGFSGVPAGQLPEWFCFEYSECPATYYGISLTLAPSNDMVEIRLSERPTRGGSATVPIAKIKDEISALFSFVSSITWKGDYWEPVIGSYSWGLNMVIGDTHYKTAGDDDMPQQLPELPELLDSLVIKAIGTEKDIICLCPDLVY